MLHLRDILLPMAPPFYREGQQRVSFGLGKGDIQWISGPLGSGKTALLETIALKRSVCGHMQLLGHPVTARTPSHTRETLRRLIGFFDEQPVFFDHLTVMENVALPLDIDGYRRRDLLREVSAILRYFQLEAIADTYPSTHNVTTRLKIACARALIRRPALLLVEASSLTEMPDFRALFFATLRDLARDGTAILLTTRDRTLISELPAPEFQLPHRPPSSEEGHTLFPNSAAPSLHPDQRREPTLS